jgi:hypothetical protein
MIVTCPACSHGVPGHKSLCEFCGAKLQPAAVPPKPGAAAPGSGAPAPPREQRRPERPVNALERALWVLLPSLAALRALIVLRNRRP